MTLSSSRLGWALLLLLLAFALVAPLVDALGPFKQSLMKALSGPDAAAPFGYDHLGRSLFARLAHALRLSLGIALGATASAAVLGIALGVLASWRGGWVDRALSLVADSVLALPALLMVLMMGVILPATALSFWAGLALVQWIEFFRLTRSATRSLVASPAVEAARLQGFGLGWIFRRILWPEIGPMLRTTMAFGSPTPLPPLPPSALSVLACAPPRRNWA
ncbi:ABC transporter permease [Pararhodospirillum photometricum]|uniref:Oligopeptide transport system permease protein OppC n=1 Tax=Pararhodospirillum photometricum DSM 122 TaxID=1150469 RepID=H6SLM0_PARPM|nr:ABC transporter permease subunit [Pararhodospirillum photometricum]CCG08885.1 Oligopeptide transport system permease protein OppC [Pararhodospirillum photometricum DSM 122]